MADEEEILREEAKAALGRVQEFDPQSLIRREDLGKYAFDDAVEPAKKVIALFKTLPVSHLDYLPRQQLDVVKNGANSLYNLLEQFGDFDVGAAEPSASEAQDKLIQGLRNQFQGAFNQLAPLIAFTTVRSQDFASLEQEARAVAQSARDSANAVVSELENQKESAAALVSEMRELAAEQGVSNQAIHFSSEADKHKGLSDEWRKYTILSAIAVVTYSIASLFLHHLPGLQSENGYQSIQIGLSKFLVFAVLTYVLLLCARNFLAHKHNEIVNRHRQNALATFKALAEATSDAASSDIVLSHAAACIFGPQETGYTKGDNSQSEGVPALQIIPRVGATGAGSAG